MKRRSYLGALASFTAGCASTPVAPSSSQRTVRDKVQISGESVFRKSFDLQELDYGAYPNDSDDRPQYTQDDLDDIEAEHTKEWEGQSGYHPFRQAHWIMYLHNSERKASSEAEAAFHQKIQELVNVEIENAHLIGNSHLAPYKFDDKFYSNPEMLLSAPWFSAISQGALLSAYTRLSNYHPDNDLYETHRDQIFNSFLRLNSNSDPWIATIDDGYYWAEEHPLSDKPPHTLNGFIYGIFGLYEYWLETKSKKSRDLLESALTTILDNKERFRVNGEVSYYDLRMKGQFEHYHTVHIRQFRKLAIMTGEEDFHIFADGLVRDAPQLAPHSPEPNG